MKEFRQSLYKLDSKQKLRIWTVSTFNGELHQESGLINGKLAQAKPVISKPKNLGKSNETSSQEQAVLEAQSKVRKKLDEGYFETQAEAEKSDFKSPMLAKKYEEEEHKIDWTNCYVQPKSDGMRCFKEGQKMTSRKGKDISTLPHILTTFPGISDIIDGELYAHGLDFEGNMELIKKNRPESTQIKFHVYDIALPLPFSERSEILKTLVEANPSDAVELVPTYKVESFAEVSDYHLLFLEQGFEGTMVRWGDEGYKFNSRSSNLLKYKFFIDMACEITDILEGDKDPEQGFVECRLPEKKWLLYSKSGRILDIKDSKELLDDGPGIIGYDYPRFKSGMKFGHARRQEVLRNKSEYIGTVAEIRFFQWTRIGLPRFSQCVGFRLDK